jgi:hypothetical protein
MTPEKLLDLMDQMIQIDGDEIVRLRLSTASPDERLSFYSRRLARTMDMLCLTIAFVASHAKHK